MARAKQAERASAAPRRTWPDRMCHIHEDPLQFRFLRVALGEVSGKNIVEIWLEAAVFDGLDRLRNATAEAGSKPPCVALNKRESFHPVPGNLHDFQRNLAAERKSGHAKPFGAAQVQTAPSPPRTLLRDIGHGDRGVVAEVRDLMRKQTPIAQLRESSPALAWC